MTLDPADGTSTGSRARVAVAGARGFVGTHLVARLVAEGYDVHALLRDPQGLHACDHVALVADDRDAARRSTRHAGVGEWVHWPRRHPRRRGGIHPHRTGHPSPST